MGTGAATPCHAARPAPGHLHPAATTTPPAHLVGQHLPVDVKGGVGVKVRLVDALGLLVLLCWSSAPTRCCGCRRGGGLAGADTTAASPLLRRLCRQLAHAFIGQHHRAHRLQHATQRLVLSAQRSHLGRGGCRRCAAAGRCYCGAAGSTRALGRCLRHLLIIRLPVVEQQLVVHQRRLERAGGCVGGGVAAGVMHARAAITKQMAGSRHRSCPCTRLAAC